MVSLNFSVEKTKIRRMMADSVTSGCVNTVVCHFNYDDSYKDMDRIAVFENEHTAIHIPLNDLDECLVPASMLESTTPVYIGLLGISGAEEKTLTTGRARINIFPGVNKEASEDDGNTPTILESLYIIAAETKKLAEEALKNSENAVGQSSNALAIAASVRTDADRGKFTPKKGVDYFTAAEINSIKNASKVSVTEASSRHNRMIYVYQNGVLISSFHCAGMKNSGGNGQSWYFTDYSNSSVSGDFTAMLGFRNYGFGNGNLISGIDNDISGRGVLAGGCNNTILSCAEGALIAGKGLTCDNTRTAFALGLGNGNSIQILTDGNIRYYSGSVRITITPEKMREVFGYEA